MENPKSPCDRRIDSQAATSFGETPAAFNKMICAPELGATSPVCLAKSGKRLKSAQDTQPTVGGNSPLHSKDLRAPRRIRPHPLLPSTQQLDRQPALISTGVPKSHATIAKNRSILDSLRGREQYRSRNLKMSCEFHSKCACTDHWYGYINWTLSPVDLWISAPAPCTTQSSARLVAASQTPVVESLPIGPNQLSLYRVRPFRTLTIKWKINRAADTLPLSTADREFYLAISLQLPRTQEIQTLSVRLAGTLTDELDIVWAFCDELTKGYEYCLPVRERGAAVMLRDRRGDCGQFSSLLVALCRARKIPARVIIGTIIVNGQALPHAWAEFWSERSGHWFPVDPAFVHGQKLVRASLPDGSDPYTALFGNPNAYVAFSIGLDIALNERYNHPPRPLPLLLNPHLKKRISGRPFRWGYESLDGCIPLLQPAYPRFTGSRFTPPLPAPLGIAYTSPTYEGCLRQLRAATLRLAIIPAWSLAAAGVVIVGLSLAVPFRLPLSLCLLSMCAIYTALVLRALPRDLRSQR